MAISGVYVHRSTFDAALELQRAAWEKEVGALREALQAVLDAQHPLPGDVPGDWLRRHDTAIEAARSALLEGTCSDG